MIVGTLRERKIEEFRVALTPPNAGDLVRAGHTVLVETGAGEGAHYADAEYTAAGASIVPSMEEVYARADLVIEVKEPQPSHFGLIRAGQTLFTYLHLAPDPEQLRELVRSGAIAIAYETVSSPQGGLPLLAPMSEIAGRISV